MADVLVGRHAGIAGRSSSANTPITPSTRSTNCGISCRSSSSRTPRRRRGASLREGARARDRIGCFRAMNEVGIHIVYPSTDFSVLREETLDREGRHRVVLYPRLPSPDDRRTRRHRPCRRSTRRGGGLGGRRRRRRPSRGGYHAAAGRALRILRRRRCCAIPPSCHPCRRTLRRRPSCRVRACARA